MKKNLMAGGLFLLSGTLALMANQQPTNNSNPAYSQSNVQAQLQVNVKDDTKVLHFIRDTGDPKILTKTYVLKNADPYSIRPYLREMVQALRVDYNNAAGRGNTDYYNTYSKDNAAKTSKIFVQTGIECIRFNDGTGILMVSAEDYRFKDSPNGMGIDSLVARLDQPGIRNSSGQPKYIYFPKNRPAKDLQSMVKLVGANVSNDTVELIGGKDKVELDSGLNCLFFNTALYSRKNIEDMLALYDIAYPEVRLTFRIYEFEGENDGMMGVDFQNWKNNDGVKLLSTGGRWSRNYNIRDILTPLEPDGTINSHYFNFEPKWNTRFLDFLVSKGKAKIAYSGTIACQNGTAGEFERKSGIMTAAVTPLKSDDSGNKVDVKPSNNEFTFKMSVTPSITNQTSTLQLNLETVSMIGYDSAGAIRKSQYKTAQTIQLSNGKTRFYVGGLKRSQVVRDVGGVPLLKDLPLLGFLFATERESMKSSNLVLVAECEPLRPDSHLTAEEEGSIEQIRKDAEPDSEFNSYGYRQLLLDSGR